MKVGVIVNKGFEKVAVMQIREILEGTKNLRIDDSIVVFESKEWDDIYRFVYKNQIANRVIYLIDDFEYKDDEELVLDVKKCIDSVKDTFLKNLIIGGVDFRVSVRIDEHTDVTYTEAEIGGVLIDYAKTLGKDLKVNLKNPAMNFYIYIYNGHAYVGIDLSDDLSKRDYKIFNNAVSLKGPTAFGLLMLAGYKPKDIYLNPCCYSGILEIEAALYATQMSHRFYNKSFPFMKFPENVDVDWDKFFQKMDSERITEKFPITGSDKLLSSITAAVKNAKIAGVESAIDFRRIDMDWMDIKFEENDVDKMIMFIPGSSKHDKNLGKEFKELFYQAEYIMKNSGKLVIMCLSQDLLLESSKEHFDLDHEAIVHSGGQVMHVLFFKRKGKETKKDSEDKQDKKNDNITEDKKDKKVKDGKKAKGDEHVIV